MADDLRKDLHLADRPVPFLGRALLVHRYGSPHYDDGYGTLWGGPRFYGPGGTWRCSPYARSSC